MAKLKAEEKKEQSIFDKYVHMKLLNINKECRVYMVSKGNGEKNILKRYNFEDNFYLTNEHMGLKLSKAKAIKSPYTETIVEANYNNDNDLHIFFEYCEGTNLKDDIEKRKKHWKYYSNNELWTIITELLLGLFEYFKVGLKHGNILLNNILLTPDGHVKLGEFRITKPSLTLRRASASSSSSSPSAVQAFSDSATDLRQLGIVLFELCMLRSFSSADLNEFLQNGALRLVKNHFHDSIDKEIMLLTMVLLRHETDSGIDLLKVLSYPSVASKLPRRYETEQEIHRLTHRSAENSFKDTNEDRQKCRDYSQIKQRDDHTEDSIRDTKKRHVKIEERVPSQIGKSTSISSPTSAYPVPTMLRSSSSSTSSSSSSSSVCRPSYPSSSLSSSRRYDSSYSDSSYDSSSSTLSSNPSAPSSFCRSSYPSSSSSSSHHCTSSYSNPSSYPSSSSHSSSSTSACHPSHPYSSSSSSHSSSSSSSSSSSRYYDSPSSSSSSSSSSSRYYDSPYFDSFSSRNSNRSSSSYYMKEDTRNRKNNYKETNDTMDFQSVSSFDCKRCFFILLAFECSFILACVVLKFVRGDGDETEYPSMSTALVAPPQETSTTTYDLLSISSSSTVYTPSFLSRLLFGTSPSSTEISDIYTSSYTDSSDSSSFLCNPFNMHSSSTSSSSPTSSELLSFSSSTSTPPPSFLSKLFRTSTSISNEEVISFSSSSSCSTTSYITKLFHGYTTTYKNQVIAYSSSTTTSSPPMLVKPFFGTTSKSSCELVSLTSTTVVTTPPFFERIFRGSSSAADRFPPSSSPHNRLSSASSSKKRLPSSSSSKKRLPSTF